MRLHIKSNKVDDPFSTAAKILKEYPKSKAIVIQDEKNKVLKNFIVDFVSKEDGDKFKEMTKLQVFNMDERMETVEETKYSKIVVSNPKLSPPQMDNIVKFRYDTDLLLPLSPVDTVFAVFIPNVHMSFDNPNVWDYKLFGTDIYTDDSDLVSIAIHTNHFVPEDPSPFSTELRGDNKIGVKREYRVNVPKYPDYHLILLLQVTHPLKIYHPLLRHDIPSRGFALHDGNSITILRSHKQPIN